MVLNSYRRRSDEGRVGDVYSLVLDGYEIIDLSKYLSMYLGKMKRVEKRVQSQKVIYFMFRILNKM